MITIEDIAKRTVSNFDNQNEALDPATITAIITLITQVISAIQTCKPKTPAHAAEMVRKPGLFARLTLRGIVRDNMSRVDFREHGEEVIKALVKTGASLTDQEVADLLAKIV